MGLFMVCSWGCLLTFLPLACLLCKIWVVIIPISVFLYRSKSIMHKDFNTVSGLKKNIQSLLSSTVIIFFYCCCSCIFISFSGFWVKKFGDRADRSSVCYLLVHTMSYEYCMMWRIGMSLMLKDCDK